MTDPLTEMLASLKEKLRAANDADSTTSEPGHIDDVAFDWADEQCRCEPGEWCSANDLMKGYAAGYRAALDPDLVAALIGCAEALERIQKMDKRAADWDRQHNVLAYADGPCGQLACDALAQLRKLAEGRRG